MIQKETIIKNKLGLHARPAGVLTKAATKYKSDIKIEANGKMYNAKSLLNILSAAIKEGTKIVLHINGEDEKLAEQELITLIESGLGE